MKSYFIFINDNTIKRVRGRVVGRLGFYTESRRLAVSDIKTGTILLILGG